ncbi:MAG TPA: copper-translocating P-type ATPase [Nitrososphaeraceae archaeon]|nr:copper-translocating P-type ATPase [Nitrososphaeraceae archaeon]
MRKNIINFLLGKQNGDVSDNNNTINENDNDDNDDDDGCIDCGCTIPKTSISSTSLEKKEERYNIKEEEEQEKEYNEEEKEELKKAKFLIILGIALTIPLVIIETFYYKFTTTDYILLGLATLVQLILGKPFYTKFYYSLIKRKFFTINTLVVLSTTIAYIYSIISMINGQELRFFEASASVLTIFTIGEYLENKVLYSTSESIMKLIALKPKTAMVIRSDGKRETVNVGDIVTGDIFIVRPGENIATDGVIVSGESSVDESMITGESIPTDKSVGNKVIGGTMNKSGYLEIKATNVGSQTVLANIVEMIKKAQATKPSIQRIADIIAKYFIPLIFIIALASSIYWIVVEHASLQFVITVFATILVVSCPCALGIATPMVVSLGIGKAAREGILIKGGKYLEKLASIDTIVFDKTGTLTKGKPEVTDIIPNDGYNENYVLQMAYSVEVKSQHPIAKAIVNKSSEKNISSLSVTAFNSIPGHGVIAKLKEQEIFLGSPRANNVSYDKSSSNYYYSPASFTIPETLQTKIMELEKEGKTVVSVFVEDKLIGIIAVADTIRNNAIQIVHHLKNMGKQVILLTGDNKRTAYAIAKKLDIENVLAEVLPNRKAEEIKKLQDKDKRTVAMIGDGINDAPALTQADIGIAMGSGTDIAMSAGHVILMRNDLSGVIYALKLGQYSMKKIKENLAISFTYNSITIPIAAGILYSITNSLILTPGLAALGWIISDSSVFGNSMLIKNFSYFISSSPNLRK